MLEKCNLASQGRVLDHHFPTEMDRSLYLHGWRQNSICCRTDTLGAPTFNNARVLCRWASRAQHWRQLGKRLPVTRPSGDTSAHEAQWPLNSIELRLSKREKETELHLFGLFPLQRLWSFLWIKTRSSFPREDSPRQMPCLPTHLSNQQDIAKKKFKSKCWDV